MTAGKTIEEATYLSVYLERAARMQIRARAFGPLTPVDDTLAREAHDYLLQPSIVGATFEYWCRQTRGVPLGSRSTDRRERAHALERGPLLEIACRPSASAKSRLFEDDDSDGCRKEPVAGVKNLWAVGNEA
nr:MULTISPECIES: hypothetical protein [unclassified Bradyrhizobium]